MNTICSNCEKTKCKCDIVDTLISPCDNNSDCKASSVMLNYYNHVDTLKYKANSNQINNLHINTVQGFNFTLVMPQMSCNRYNYNFTCNLPNRDIQCSNSGSLLNDSEIINVLRTYTQSNMLHNTNQ